MRLVFVFTLAISFICTPCRGEDPAPTFHHDNQRTGRTSNLGPKVPRLRWSFRSESSLEASPVISRDGTIYLASTDGRLYAFTSRGILKWTFAAGDAIVATPAIGPDGIVHLGDIAGTYYAVRPDGSLKWSRQLTGGALERRVTAPPAVAGSGQSFVGSWNDRLYSFGPDGSLLWTYAFEGEGQIGAAPALDLAGNVYLATHDPANKSSIAVYRFDSASPAVVWKFTEDMGIDRNRIISSPAIDVSRGRLYVGAARDIDGCMYAIDIADGKRAFRADFPKGIISSPAVGRDGTLFVGCLDGKLYALDPATGNARWSFATGAPYVMGSPTVDGASVIYVGDSDGVLHAISAVGQEQWSCRLGANIASAPCIADDGAIYVTSFDSTLYVIGEMRGRRIPR